MKVLLLNPPTIWGRHYVREGRCQQEAGLFVSLTPQITLASIAALLEENRFDVSILDCMAQGVEVTELLERIKAQKPRLVLMNVSTPTFMSDLHVARLLKKGRGSITLGAIGVHVTALPEESLSYGVFDFCVRGETELSVLEVAKRISEGSKNLCGIAGVSYVYEGIIAHNTDRELLIDLDSLPFPARHLLPNAKYRFPLTGEVYTSITIVRGCPGACIFCTANMLHGRMPRYRSIESILCEIRQVIRQFAIRNFLFYGENVTANQEFLEQLCDCLVKENIRIRWVCNSRVDTITEQLSHKMRLAGCWLVSFGIESGDFDVLKRSCKGIGLSQSQRAVKLAEAAGIKTVGHFIFGLPGETNGTIERTIVFACELGLSFAEFYIAVPFPGSKLFKLFKKKKKGWYLYEYSHTAFCSSLNLLHAQRKAYLKFYVRPSSILVILRTLNVRNCHSFLVALLKFLKFVLPHLHKKMKKTVLQ